MYSSSSVSTLDGRLLGTLGYLRTQEGEPEWAGAELDWKVLLAASRKTPTYHPLPDTAPVKEDLTLTIPEGTPVGAVLERMKQADPLVTSVTFKDQYQQNWTFTVTYQDPTKQLGREDVVPARQKLVAAAQAHGAKLVG